MNKIEVIAEAGSNHNGDVGKAIELIDITKESGANSVKFQFIFADGLYLPKFSQNGKTPSYVDNSVFNIRKNEELTNSQWEKIWSYALTRGINISASVFCKRGISLLSSLGAPFVKIASTDFTNINLIESAIDAFDRVIISTGMASIKDLGSTIDFLDSQNLNNSEVELMHCVSRYPCPLSSSNLNRIALLRNISKYRVGYSDHTEGNESSLMALSLGVTVFEKHFTMDQELPGFDHKHAANPQQLQHYIETLNNGCRALQQNSSFITEEEVTTSIRARRGVYAARDLEKGKVVNADDLLYVRPSTLSSLSNIDDFLGRVVQEDVHKYTALGGSDGIKGVKSNWKGASEYWSNEMIEKKMKK